MDGRIPFNAASVASSYMEMINEHKLILPIMKILANVNNGILYHCTAGKDRTGVISALLLSLAGVQQVDIVADYQISQYYLSRMLEEFCKNNKDVPAEVITPKREYMEDFLNIFYKKYNSVEKYLYFIGLNNNEIIKLKQKLRN